MRLPALWEARDYGETSYVTGMRAFAAMAVLFIHSGGGGLREAGPAGAMLVDLGRCGVDAFFVISGFSIAAAFRPAHGFSAFMARRFFRLAPLYYAWVLGLALSVGAASSWAEMLGRRMDAYDLFMHLGFLHAFDPRVANSIVGAEWSMSVEMFWYLCLPLLVGLARRGWLPWAALASVAWFMAERWLYGRYGAAYDGKLGLFLTWMPLSYPLNFVLGVWAQQLREKVAEGSRSRGVALSVAGLAAFVGLSMFRGAQLFEAPLAVSLTVFGLLVFGSNGERQCRPIFCNSLAQRLGLLSYGIYLSHLPIAAALASLGLPGLQQGQLAYLAVLSLLAVLVSMLGYALIEAPGMRLGRVVEGYFREKVK